MRTTNGPDTLLTIAQLALKVSMIGIVVTIAVVAFATVALVLFPAPQISARLADLPGTTIWLKVGFA